jgi:hypothetical protein
MSGRFGTCASAGLLAVTLLSSCSGGSMVSQTVGGHRFKVPKKNLVDATIPWLPMSQSDALKFVVNPEAPVQRQWLVTVEPATTSCRPSGTLRLSQLDQVCAKGAGGGVGSNTQRGLQKVHPDGDATQWEYHLKPQNGDNAEQVVASCYALSAGGRGLCTALSRYDDLIVSTRFEESDVYNLTQIQFTTKGLLSGWEQSSR